ncbi:MAG: tol-pal system-associated acyl-CoA thioesterase [Rhodocyclaceae bacterium]|nr:MAG: tol-pal system-associated acyl-CoA thioesterase [Rhodocyclaceae bacterium]
MHASTPPAPVEGKRLFSLPVRVYYEDTDAGGVVYYANYLKFCERARTEVLRALGFEQNRLSAEQDILFVVRTVQADYLRFATLDYLLYIATTISKLGHASLSFAQQIRREDTTIFAANITIACIRASTKRPTPIPPAVRALFAPLVETDERH